MRTPMQDLRSDDSQEAWPEDADADAATYDDDRAADGACDPVRCMHDTEEGAGDETGLADLYLMDTLAAEQRGVALDPAGGQEAALD
ncbi:MAG: hypothetical protein JWM64_1202 [Frankiales bacterium]|nr:hypothetical protein [Frankiales bacterium]